QVLRLGHVGMSLLGLLLFSVGIALPFLSIMLIRDKLLLRRVRFVLRARGACPSCRYSLLGIVVSADNIVICPECGMEVEADPSLKELTTDEQGRQRFTPTEQIKVRRFWTPRRVRRLKRAAIALAVLVFVVLPAGWGVYEVFLFRQAKTAAAERPGVAGIMAFIESHQEPGVTPHDTNAWDLFYEAQREQFRISGLNPPPQSKSGAPIFPYYRAVYDSVADRYAFVPDADQLEQDEMSRAYALDLIAAYKQQGLFDIFDRLAACRRVVRVPVSSPNEPIDFGMLDEFRTLSDFGKMHAARMKLAMETGDLEEFLSALEASLALVRMCDHDLGLFGYVHGFMLEQRTAQLIADCLSTHPSIEWVNEIELIINRQRSILRPSYHVEGELLLDQDTLGWFFEKPQNVRFGLIHASVAGWFSSDGLSTRLGTYRYNSDVLREYYDQAAARIDDDPSFYTAFPRYEGPANHVLFGLILDTWERTANSIARRNAHRRGTSTMLALEHHFLDHGTYPDSLSSLVPEYLDALPADPWTGEPLLYRTTPGEGIGYLLYSVGPDATDDGGKPNSDIAQPRGMNPDIILSPPAHSPGASSDERRR
ncbi:type II secretion system protein GspG, partial [bacterium AH-315-K20]|nr:type II secretion system protein GspG [bacterium AH-315-K20]